MKVVLTRIAVAVLFIPLILFVLFNGGYLLLTFLALITMIATYELRGMFSKKQATIPVLMIPLNFIFLVLFMRMSCSALLLAAVTVFVIVAGYDILTNRLEGSLSRITISIFTVIYPTFFLSYAFHINNHLAGGNYLLISIIAVIWATDTFAYFCGMAIGKHRGIFKVSPHKSLEGFICGFLGAIGISYLLYLFFREHYTLPQAVLIGISAGIFGQFGDLIESAIKRETGVKDSSSLIPGHGGVLDRFDSFIFTLPVFYLINQFLNYLL